MKFEQYINEQGEISEVLGYKIKAGDKKIIKAFIDGATEGKGNVLWIEGDYLFGPSSYSTTDYVAKREKNKIVSGYTYGNITQTWHNFIKKNT